MTYHEPVLVKEALENLKVRKGGLYIDCTLGDGGHSLEILSLGGKVLGIDYNQESLNRALERIKNENFTGVLGNFKDIEKLTEEHDFTKVNGIIYDLGFSSSQMAEDKGLSFSNDQPLDMRLDPSLNVTAADLVNTLPEKALAQMFSEHGGERYAKSFARAITIARNLKKFQTTSQLAQVIVGATSPGYENGRIHPATRVFQALRIAVNDELGNLKISLPRAAHLLLPGGRMIVISFHSLEDKIAKELSYNARLRINELTKKPIVPNAEEVQRNTRARSAKMRVFEKS